MWGGCKGGVRAHRFRQQWHDRIHRRERHLDICKCVPGVPQPFPLLTSFQHETVYLYKHPMPGCWPCFCPQFLLSSPYPCHIHKAKAHHSSVCAHAAVDCPSAALTNLTAVYNNSIKEGIPGSTAAGLLNAGFPMSVSQPKTATKIQHSSLLHTNNPQNSLSTALC